MEYETESFVENAYLVGVILPEDDKNVKEDSLLELERLATTAGIAVKGRFLQSRKNIVSATYLGKGYLEELEAMMKEESVNLLIFDNELTPTQSRNLYRKYSIEAIDRTELILEIFRRHAKTKEARLQVSLANLKYQLPRLKKLWSHLDRERGTASGSSGTSRGMGEKQIEVDKRIIRDEIKRISTLLDKIMVQKTTQRKRRDSLDKICLVGYTNAGKSTIFNKITAGYVLAEDKLFATLDSTARNISFGKGKEAIISDTVGFISNLPHNLVASFRATLKDAVDADLLLHIVDISDERCEFYLDEVNKVLNEIGISSTPILLVFNKVDLLPSHRVREDIVMSKYAKSIVVSAHTRENLEDLHHRIKNLLDTYSDLTFQIPYDNSKEISELYSKSEVKSRSFEKDGVLIETRISDREVSEFKRFLVRS